MADSLRLVLRQSVEEVLEKMFFIRSLSEAAGELPLWENAIMAHLSFEGEPSGSLTVRVTRDAARTISADFLGADESELTQQQVGEVVCELANMICGSVLSRVESAATFRLVSPQIAEGEGGVGETTEPAGTRAIHSVEIVGGNLTVVVKTESPLCSTTEKPAF